MKKLIKTLTLAAAIITSLGGVAQAGSCSLPSTARDHYQPRGNQSQRYEHFEYYVEYFDCSCGKWHCYGVYDHKCEAKAVARKIAAQGIKVRILLEVN